MYKIMKDYREEAGLRNSFNELAKKTFGLDFEDWYQNGFWGDNYNPYSIVVEGKVVANVSVNKTDMFFDGRVRHFLQLGTVMTEEAYRNRGLIRRIMEQIESDYNGKVEGIYLFGNDSVLEFYPKFGFKKSAEYQYSREVLNTGESQMEKVVMDNPAAWKRLENAMKGNLFHGKFDMVNNPELIMFYVTKFMRESVYYHKETDTYVIADIEDGKYSENLSQKVSQKVSGKISQKIPQKEFQKEFQKVFQKVFLHNVFSSKLKELDKVIELFGKGINEVTLGFVPAETEAYNVTQFQEEDCTLFIKGKTLEIVETEWLRLPSLAHA